MGSASNKVIDCVAYNEIRTQMAQEALARQPAGTKPKWARMSSVAPKDLLWLWPGRLPLGKMVVLDGDPGLGKSVLTLDLAARVSRGGSMPDGSRGDVDGPAGVVLLSVEDDPEDTIRPRLDAADADVERVAIMQAVCEPPTRRDAPMGRERLPTIQDTDAIREVIEETAAKLVIIDPLMAFLTGDSHRDQDVRQALSPLATMAAQTGATVLVVRHLNKSGGDNALYRGGGSIGIIGAARSGLLAAKDPDDPTNKRRVLAVTKCNLAVDTTEALAYHLEPCGRAVRAVWEGASEHTQQTLLAGIGAGEKQRPVDEAVVFLRGILADGPMPCNQVQERATEQGISQRTLDRARRKLGVRSTPTGFGGPRRWTLPSPCQFPASPDHPQKVAITDKTEQNRGNTGEFDVFGLAKTEGPSAKVAITDGIAVSQLNSAESPVSNTIPDPLPPQVQLALDILGGTVTKFRYPGDDDE